MHLWWSRKPLATARAVIFAQMVDDPSGYVDVLLSDLKKRRAAERELKKRLAAKRALAHDDAIAESEPMLEEIIAEQERDRLFAIIEELVLWENTTNEEVLEPARREIWQSWRRACAENAGHPRATEVFDRHTLPAFHDPFAGGGALPLEAQRLGLEAHASDVNPVAVLINKAMIEIPPNLVIRFTLVMHADMSGHEPAWMPGVIRRENPGDSIDFAQRFAIKHGRPDAPDRGLPPRRRRYTSANVSTR